MKTETKLITGIIVCLVILASFIAVMGMMDQKKSVVSSNNDYLNFVSKTEYVVDDVGQVIVELLDFNHKHLLNATCNASVWYPNKSPFILNQPMNKVKEIKDIVPLQNGLLVCAPLANTNQDIWSNEYNATFVGSPVGHTTGGLFGGYYSTDGVNDKIQFSNNPGTSSFTVMFDIRLTSAGVVISNSNGNSGFDLSITSSGKWWNRIDSNGWSYSSQVNMVTNVLDGQWHRIVYQIARDGSNKWRVWVDGVKEVDASMGLSYGRGVQSWMNLNADSFTFGYSGKDGTYNAVDVSNYHYWNRLVSEDEAETLWNYGFGTTCEDMVAGVAVGRNIGTYFINFTIPNVEGEYEYQATCSVNGKSYTKSNSFHVSSGFRRVIDSNIFILDEGMDTQQYPLEVKNEWMLRGADVNITSAKCWVDNNDGRLTKKVLLVPAGPIGYCSSYFHSAYPYKIFSESINHFSYCELNYPEGSNGTFMFEISNETLWVKFFGMKVTSTSGGILRVVLRDESENVVYYNDTLSLGTGTFGGNTHIVILPLKYDFLEANHVYNLTFTEVSGETYVCASNVTEYDSYSINPFYIKPLTNDGSLVPWLIIMGNASNVPGVYVDIDEDSQKIIARWDPHKKRTVYHGVDYVGYQLEVGGDYTDSTPCNSGVFETLNAYNNNTVMEFLPNANFETVCDVEYTIEGRDNMYIKRLTKNTFIRKDGKIRAVAVK